MSLGRLFHIGETINQWSKSARIFIPLACKSVGCLYTLPLNYGPLSPGALEGRGPDAGPLNTYKDKRADVQGGLYGQQYGQHCR